MAQDGQQFQLLVAFGVRRCGEDEQGLGLVLGEQHLAVQLDGAQLGMEEHLVVAMPLDEFIAEAVALLESQPGATEIQVERVKFLRYGEARGDYDQVVATLNASDPHGK